MVINYLVPLTLWKYFVAIPWGLRKHAFEVDSFQCTVLFVVFQTCLHVLWVLTLLACVPSFEHALSKVCSLCWQIFSSVVYKLLTFRLCLETLVAEKHYTINNHIIISKLLYPIINVIIINIQQASASNRTLSDIIIILILLLSAKLIFHLELLDHWFWTFLLIS